MARDEDYSPASFDESDEEKLSLLEARQLLDFQIQKKSFSRRLRLSTAGNVLLLIALIVTWTVFLGDGWPFKKNMALNAFNFPSPLLDDLKLKFRYDTINGSLWNGNDAIYRKYPSAEVDEAWHKLSVMKLFPITKAQVEEIGRDPLEAAKIPPEWGYGNDVYPAYLDVQHQLHCLNHIRMYAYWPHYYSPRYGNDSSIFNSPVIHEYHLSHCLYILMQELACRPSLSVDTLNFISHTHGPNVDVRVNKKCLPHEDLLDWQTKKSFLNNTEYLNIPPQPNQKYLLPPLGTDPGLDL